MEAEKLYCQAANKSEEVLGTWHPWTSACMHQLGCLFQRTGSSDVHEGMEFCPQSCANSDPCDQGRLSEAEDFFRRALQGREELGLTGALEAANDLANFFRSVGKLQKALSIVESLGNRLQDQGKFKEVDDLYKTAIKRSEEQQALRGREKVLGPSHPETLVSSSHVGYLCVLRGSLPEAQKLLQRALRGLEEQLDGSHLQTLLAVDHMGCLLVAQNRLGEAEKFFKRALRGREKQLGASHADTIVSLQHLASFTQDEAEELWRRSSGTGGAAGPRGLRAAAGLAKNLLEQSCFPEAVEAIEGSEQGHLEEAEQLLRRTVEETAKQLGAQHPVTLSYQLELSDVLRARAKPEAKEMMRSTVKGRQEQLGRHVETLRAERRLAALLKRQAEPEAEQLLKTALEGYEALDPSSEELEVAEELAELLFTKAKYAAAEELRTAHAERAERLRRQLVTVLRCQGRLGEAEDLARELGTKAGDLSLNCQDQEKMEEAESLHRQALQEREKQLCATHPWTLLCYSRLAATLHARGKLPEAEDFCRRALAGSEVELNQTETLHYINRLAKVLQAQGHMQEAEELQQRMMPGLIYVESSALLCLVKGNGRMQDSTLTSLSHLGSLLHERGKLQEAEDLLRRVLSEREEMEPLHLDTLSSSCALAAVLRDAGKTQEAEELYKSALEGVRLGAFRPPMASHGGLRRAPGEVPPRDLESHQRLGSFAAGHPEPTLRLERRRDRTRRQELNDLNEAERLQRWVYEERQTVLGPDHAETLSSCYALGALLETKGADADEVEELLRKALEGRQKQLGPVHAEVLEVISRLANFLEKLGEVTEAQKLYIQELQAMEELFGVGHKRTQQSRRKLEDFLRNIRESFPEEAETEVVSRTNSRTSRANSDGASRSNSVPDSGTSDGKASRRDLCLEG
eukprot:g30965.t1